MIAVNINAGLGNQMFHYAFGRGLAAKGLDVCYDQVNFKPRKDLSHEEIKLQDAFPYIDIKLMTEGHFRWVVDIYSDKGRIKKKWASYMIKLHNFIGDETYILEPSYGYCEGMEKLITDNCIFRGYWQSEKYFNNCVDDIRKQFTFLPFDEPKNIQLIQKLSCENSVAVHLRKSKDYIESDLMGKGLCTADYYKRAIEYIRNYVDNPVFYVFTDNPDWLKENLPLFEYTLVDWNEISGKRSFRDMQLMTCCKHNIIANSTYSWWGAWLNPNPHKIVIAPNPFFNPVNEFFSSSDIVCDSWVTL